MAFSRLYKRLLWFVLSCALLVLMAFAGLVAWVITGPRSLDALTPYIESALSPSGAGYHVRIGASLLTWDGWTHPVGIRVKNVDLLDDKGASLARFSEVGIRMYFFELLRGRVDIKSIELLKPVVKFTQDANGKITSFGVSSDTSGSEGQLAALLSLLASETGDNPISRLKSLTIRHASLSVEDSHGAAFLASPDASIEISRAHGEAHGRLRMPLQFDGKRSELDIRFDINGNHHTVTSNVVFSDVTSGVLAAMAPTQKWMEGVHVGLSGWANMSSDFDGNISAIDFMIEAGEGTVNLPDQLEHALNPRYIKVEGNLSDHLTTLTVKDCLLDFPGHSLTFKGVVHRVDDDYGVDGYAEATSISTDSVHDYWPLKLAPHTRHWVVTHVSKGKVVSANATLHFKPGEFKLKNTPDAAIDSVIVLKGATIAYKPTHPVITDIDGTMHFTGRTMDARISSAHYMNDTHITAARLRFPDFYPDDVKLVIDMDLDTSASDIQRFLSLPDLNKAAKLNFTQEATGQVSGSVKLDFIAFSENDKDDVGATGKINYAISGNLKDASQKRFLGNRDIENAFMKLTVDNKGLKLSGKAKINTIPMNIDLNTSFGRKNETSYEIKANVPVQKLPDFGLPRLDFAAGTLGVDASFLSADDQDKADAVVDLTQASISLPKQELDKKIGERATLTLSTQQLPSGNTLIKPFSFRGDGYMVAGSAEYNRQTNDFSTFSLAPVKLGRMDLDTLDYQQQGGTIRLNAKGNVFNASRYLADSSGHKGDLGYLINLHASKLILGDGRELSNASVEADCPPDTCRSAHISAKLADGAPFDYAIGGGRLEAITSNAGELAHVLGIIDTMDGGKMSLTGEYKGGNLEGTLEIKEYTIKRAPVMTKIFTIASLTGLLDTLTGNGIYFDRLTAPFIYHKGVIILKEAKTHGAALGITADGVIDTNKPALDLSGVLVPSYTLNSLIGNVPLIGNLITGGSGKGLVALTYSVHGTMQDPSVRVNPLSVLTPGFLRNIFTIFDKPPPDMNAIQAQKSAVDATAAAAAKTVPPVAATPAAAPVPEATPASAAPPAALVPQGSINSTKDALPSPDELNR